MSTEKTSASQDYCVAFAEVFRRAPEAGVMYDPGSGVVAEVNDSFRVLTGWRPEEVLNRPFAGFFADPDLPGCHPGEPLTRRMMIRKSDGNWIPVDAFFSFAFRKDHVYCLAFLKDASGFIKLLESFERSEERFRTMTENCPLGMHFYRIEAKDRLIFTGANPAADRILGISHKELIGRTIEESFPDLAGTGIPERYRAIAREGGLWSDKSIRYEDQRVSGVFEVQVFQAGLGRVAVMFRVSTPGEGTP